MKHHHAWLFAFSVALAPLASAGVIDTAQQAASQQSWSAWGGDLGVRWNHDLLRSLDISLGKTQGQLAQTDLRGHQWFPLRENAGLQFIVQNSALAGFSGGALQSSGGYRLTLADGSQVDLRNMAFRPRAGDPRVLDIVSSDGNVWFYSDRIMAELAGDGHTLIVHAADMRISQALADRMGNPEASGWEIADLAMNTRVFVQGTNVQPERVCNPYPWPNVAVPNVPNATYQADLFMKDFASIDPVGCKSSTGGNCDGPGGDDGIASFAASSELINNVNNGTAVPTVPGDPLGTSSALYVGNIAWYTMFSGNPPNYNPPYKNDQHPFLIWNVYRINADGSIEQIGRSGVKHAFFNSDYSCLDSCNDNHSLGRGCQDEYGTGNNDSPQDMGPRSEIVPATGVWGRCGSIWDPSCTGNEQPNGNNSWTQRLQMHESQLDPALNPGATYRFEAWYVARDDINIYNSMKSSPITPTWSAGSHLWVPVRPNPNGERLGPAIDRWVDPTNPPANSMNTELASSEGHVKVAVKVTDNGNGTWTYQYAVMNLDFARAVVQSGTAGSSEDPRVLSNKGFDRFSVPVGAAVTAATFKDGEVSQSNDWTFSNANGTASWYATPQGIFTSTAAARGKPTLDWGTLYSFSFVANSAPISSTATLHVAKSGTPASYSVATLVPAN